MGAVDTEAAIARRLASMGYEALLLSALLMFATLIYLLAERAAGAIAPRTVLQLYLWLVALCYFSWCWSRSGQTLAMKTWRLCVQDISGQPLTLRRAVLRFILACPSVALGIGVAWALIDRDRRFLHDRLMGTQIVRR
ncbi:MAG: RDD family protein [Burkholderiales bacterium]